MQCHCVANESQTFIRENVTTVTFKSSCELDMLLMVLFLNTLDFHIITVLHLLLSMTLYK